MPSAPPPCSRKNRPGRHMCARIVRVQSHASGTRRISSACLRLFLIGTNVLLLVTTYCTRVAAPLARLQAVLLCLRFVESVIQRQGLHTFFAPNVSDRLFKRETVGEYDKFRNVIVLGLSVLVLIV